MLIVALCFSHLASTEPVEARLRKELSALSGVRFTRDSTSLFVKFNTEVVMEPAEAKSRAPSTRMVSTERPKPTGFMLETYEFPHKPTDPPRAMQAVRMNPGWLREYKTWRLDSWDRQEDGTSTARYCHLAWGVNVDPKLLKRIRAALDFGTHPIGP